MAGFRRGDRGLRRLLISNFTDQNNVGIMPEEMADSAGKCISAWTYGARHVHRFPGEARRRPLAVYRDNTVYSSLNGTTEIFRRDFDLDNGEEFSAKWITGWAASSMARKGQKLV